MTSLRSVAALVAAMTILQAASGLANFWLPLAMRGDGLDATAVGFAGAAYSAGFMVGAFGAPRFLALVGHIRIFAAAGSFVCTLTLAAHWADPLAVWALQRFGVGVCVALLFAAAESWMTAVAPASERGGVIGVYMVVSKLALAAGPALAGGAEPWAGEPLMIAAAIYALALVPICMTRAEQPAPPQPHPVAVRELIAIAPAAAAACMIAGVMNAGVMALAPLVFEDQHGRAGAAALMSAAWVGSLITQWPAARISDRIDRRLVILALAVLAAVSAAALAVFESRLPFWATLLLVAAWGGGALSFYGVAVAHMADRAHPSGLARATSGLLFLWAAGAIWGPVLAGLAMRTPLGHDGLFWFAAGWAVALGAFMAARRAARSPALAQTRADRAPKEATSLAAGDLSYGGDKGPSA
jgi:MFS family permease